MILVLANMETIKRSGLLVGMVMATLNFAVEPVWDNSFKESMSPFYIF